MVLILTDIDDKDNESDDLNENEIDELLDLDKDSEFSPYLSKEIRVNKDDELTDEVAKKIADTDTTKKKKTRRISKRLRFSSKQKMPKKRIFTDATVLVPKEYELDIVINGLKEFYKNNPHFLKGGITATQQIANVIEECKKGWPCASKTFIKRVEWKTKWNTASLATRFDSEDTYFNAKQVQLQKDLKSADKDLFPGVSASDLRKTLQPEERKFWQEREAFYKKEFEFNLSSDWSLLLQVLLEELTQYRLVRRRMIDPFDDIEFPLSESYKRLINAQKALGITREQRENSANETEGNIAQASVLYEEKIKFIEKIRTRDQIEEMAMMAKKTSGDSLKLVPEDLANILARAAEAEDATIDMFEDEPLDKENDDNDTDGSGIVAKT